MLVQSNISVSSFLRNFIKMLNNFVCLTIHGNLNAAYPNYCVMYISRNWLIYNLLLEYNMRSPSSFLYKLLIFSRAGRPRKNIPGGWQQKKRELLSQKHTKILLVVQNFNIALKKAVWAKSFSWRFHLWRYRVKREDLKQGFLTGGKFTPGGKFDCLGGKFC